MTRRERNRKVCDAIEQVLSQDTGWLGTTEVARRVNKHIFLVNLESDGYIRSRLRKLYRGGKVRCSETSGQHGYRWKWISQEVKDVL